MLELFFVKFSVLVFLKKLENVRSAVWLTHQHDIHYSILYACLLNYSRMYALHVYFQRKVFLNKLYALLPHIISKKNIKYSRVAKQCIFQHTSKVKYTHYYMNGKVDNMFEVL